MRLGIFVFMTVAVISLFMVYNAQAAPNAVEIASAAPSVAEGKKTPSYEGIVDMVYIKGGCFQMGDVFGDGNDDEKPVHEVCIEDYYMARHEVTQGLWKSVMPANQSYFKDCGEDCPVEQVSFNDAQEFIAKLNEKTGRNYRLPTEAEWEFAARDGGKNEKYAGTSDLNDLFDCAWYEDNADKRTHPVGKKKPNGLGIYDMSGNVWEWVQDVYAYRAYSNYGKNVQAGKAAGEKRSVRGGSWFDIPQYLRSTKRYWFAPTFRLFSGGFRLAASAK